jgi:hypothetical protein
MGTVSEELHDLLSAQGKGQEKVRLVKCVFCWRPMPGDALSCPACGAPNEHPIQDAEPQSAAGQPITVIIQEAPTHVCVVQTTSAAQPTPSFSEQVVEVYHLFRWMLSFMQDLVIALATAALWIGIALRWIGRGVFRLVSSGRPPTQSDPQGPVEIKKSRPRRRPRSGP